MEGTLLVGFGPCWRVHRQLWAPLACAGLAGLPRNAGAAPLHDGEAPASEPSAPAEPRAKPPWPEIAAVFPGVLVHGSGTWLQGRTRTTERFLMIEAASLLAIGVAGLFVYETGYARDWAGPATLTLAAGAGALSTSFLANLYATWAPAAGWGEPERQLPLLVSALGYTYVGDVQFADDHFLTAELEGRLGPWHVHFDSTQSPSPGNQWLALLAGHRLLGPQASSAPTRDGSYLEPQVGFSTHRFDSSGFVSRVLQFDLEGRLDAERLFDDVRGAFFQAAAGWAKQWLAFDVPGAQAIDANSMLLVHMGFGLYLGHQGTLAPSAAGGELEMYYDHRRDGFAGGLKLPGPASGFSGHVGLSGEYFFSEALGLRARAELGSSWVLGLSGLLRLGMP